MKDANNQTYELHNPQMDWHANYLTLFTIEPKKAYMIRCRLTSSGTVSNVSIKDGASLFYLTNRLGKVKRWAFPLNITGHFAAKVVVMDDLRTNWKGAIDTPTLKVTLNTEPDAELIRSHGANS